MKQYFIYLTTNQINNKKYIGYHHGTPQDNYLGSGVILTKAVKEYGRSNFSRQILEFCKNQEQALEREKYWIAHFNAVQSEEFYNISEGGENDAGWKQVQEWRTKNPEKAKELDQQATQNINKWWAEHPEAWPKRNAILKEYSTKWREEHPEEVKQQMIKINAAKEEWQRTHPEEHQKQIDEWRAAGSKANSKKVKCLTTGVEFESMSAAARFYNIPQGNISKALRGERKSAGKHPETGEKMYWAWA